MQWLGAAQMWFNLRHIHVVVAAEDKQTSCIWHQYNHRTCEHKGMDAPICNEMWQLW